MKRALLITIVLLALLPDVVKAQWTFDVVSVEAYINDHKKQRSLLLARSTLEYSNQLLHEYSRKEVGEYKELNIDLDRYTRAFDVIDVTGGRSADGDFLCDLWSYCHYRKYFESAGRHFDDFSDGIFGKSGRRRSVRNDCRFHDECNALWCGKRCIFQRSRI